MKGKVICGFCCVALAGPPQLRAGISPPPKFSYQGYLGTSVAAGAGAAAGQPTVPITDTCEFEFSLWDQDVDGTQLGTAMVLDGAGGNPPPVDVADGIFTILLDADILGLPSAGPLPYLQISVCCPAGGCTRQLLMPRTLLTYAPAAIGATSAESLGASTAEQAVEIDPTGNVGVGTASPTEKLDVDGNIHASGTIRAGNSIVINGAPPNPVIASDAGLEIQVADGRALRIESSTSSHNLIGGFADNAVTSGAIGATIGGGGSDVGITLICGLNEEPNLVTDHFGTVGGGSGNRAGDNDADPCTAEYATVGGGQANVAAGIASTVGGGVGNTGANVLSTVAGGAGNTAGGNRSTVGGGQVNQATGFASTVSGGTDNTASGADSTAPGGWSNLAGGDYSLAAGRRGKVRDGDPLSSYYSGDADGDEGTFVWADSTDADFMSTGPDQFLIRASGGVGIGTNAPEASLHVHKNSSGSVTADANSIAVLENGTHGYLTILTPSNAERGILFGDPINNHSGAIVYNPQFGNGTANSMQFRTGGGFTRMTIDSSGKVGVGVGGNETALTYPLEVGTDSTNGNGAHLTAGGVWTNGSDRNSKQHFESIDTREILRKVTELPVQRWQYKGEPAQIRHIGPVAQDFYAAFGTGDDARYIGTIDADGVALAAIQGLYDIVQEKQCEVEELREQKDQQIKELRAQVAELRALVAAVTMRNRDVR